MKYALEIKEEADLDIAEAYLYYESQQMGLGDHFLSQLDTYLERIRAYPEHYPKKRSPYREVFIKKFPYLIIYEVVETKIIVYAVFNTWQDLGKRP